MFNTGSGVEFRDVLDGFQANPYAAPSAGPVAEIRQGKPNSNWATKWEDANSSMLRSTDAATMMTGLASKSVYGLFDGVWTFSSSVKNGWRIPGICRERT